MVTNGHVLSCTSNLRHITDLRECSPKMKYARSFKGSRDKGPLPHALASRITVVFSLFFATMTILAVSLSAVPLDAQDGSAAMRGVVEDVSGARIPAALVIVTSPETGFQRAVFTDSKATSPSTC